METSPQEPQAGGAPDETCPDCGTPREPDARFCIECGAFLPAASPRAEGPRGAPGTSAATRDSLGSGLVSRRAPPPAGGDAPEEAAPAGPDARLDALDAGEAAPAEARDEEHEEPPLETDDEDEGAPALEADADAAAPAEPAREPGVAPRPSGPAPGARLADGRYLVGASLGRRGIEVLFEATDVRSRRAAVLHWIAAEHLEPGTAARLRARLSTLRDLHHPGLVRVLDVGRLPGGDFYLTEVVDGPTLADVLAERVEGFSLSEATRIVAPILDALEHVHPLLVHGRLEPRCIVLADGDPSQPKLDDLAVEAQPADPDETLLGSDAGGAEYRAPEQLRRRAADHRADLFAVGVLLYRLLTGELPGPESPRPSALRPRLPKNVDRLIGALLQRNPDLRPRGAAEVRGQLRTLSALERRRARGGAPVWLAEHARGLAIAGGAAALLIAAALLGPLAWRGGEGRPLPEVAAAPVAAVELERPREDARAPEPEPAPPPAEPARDRPPERVAETDASATPDAAESAPVEATATATAEPTPAPEPTPAADVAAAPPAEEGPEAPAVSPTIPDAEPFDEQLAASDAWDASDEADAADAPRAGAFAEAESPVAAADPWTDAGSPSPEIDPEARARAVEAAYRTQWTPQMRDAALAARAEWRARVAEGELDESVASLRAQEAVERAQRLEEQDRARDAWEAYVEAIEAYESILGAR